MDFSKSRFVGILICVTIAFLVIYEFLIVKPLANHLHYKSSTSLGWTVLPNIMKVENKSLWWMQENETSDRISYQLWLMTYLEKSGIANTTKLKLIYQVPHSNYGNPPPEGQHVFTSQQCPVRACYITRKLKDVKKADAVYLEGFKASMLKDLLPKPKNQIWAITGGESPPLNTKMNIFDSHALGSLINWTIFYRRDATISAPYGKFETFPNFTRIQDYRLADELNYAAGKTKQIAWFVSNCDYGTFSGRGNYANELSKYMKVDIYGRCGKMKCPKEEMGGCLQMLRREYKFYLSFENNCCKDYITEKFFNNALKNDVMPIVMGAHPDDYKALAPPGSYIHVDDFESPKELAEHLHLLDKNETLYNEYFRWKKTGRFISAFSWCRLCALLHANDDGSYVHWYPDFHKWWEDGVCLEKPKYGQWQSWRNKRRRSLLFL